MLWMMTTTGIRRNEMWILKKADLDWDASTIRVIHGKGQKERQITFDRRCQRAMLRYIQHRSDSLDVLIRPRSLVRVHPGPPISLLLVNSDTK